MEIIFVSPNQVELKEEREAVKEIILDNPTLRNFFDVFLFEDTPAKGESPATSYLKEVDNSDIYIGIIGKEYGVKGKDGLSPLISYLDGKGKLSKGPFDETICREAGYEAIDEREVKDFLNSGDSIFKSLD